MEPLVNKITEGGKGTANAEKLFKQGEVPLDWEESQIAIATNNFGAYSGEKSPYPEIVKIFKNFLQYPDCKTAAGTMQCEKLAKYCLVQACSGRQRLQLMQRALEQQPRERAAAAVAWRSSNLRLQVHGACRLCRKPTPSVHRRGQKLSHLKSKSPLSLRSVKRTSFRPARALRWK